jgi:hypothetical protein
MPLAAIPWHPTNRVLRQFAALWVVCGCAAAWRAGAAAGTAGGLALAGLAVAVGGPGLVRPRLIRLPFLALSLLTFPVGWAVSQAVLAGLFYLVFTPVGVVFRLTGRDALALRPAGRPSLWQPRAAPADAGRYFRQF